MTLWLLLFVAFLCVIGITLMFVAATNKAYKHTHTIDPIPKQSTTEKDHT